MFGLLTVLSPALDRVLEGQTHSCRHPAQSQLLEETPAEVCRMKVGSSRQCDLRASSLSCPEL